MTPQVFAAVTGISSGVELWRYMALSEFLTLLSDQVRLTQVAQFPDRHEGRVLESAKVVDRAIAQDFASRQPQSFVAMPRLDDPRISSVVELANRHLAYASCWTLCGPERPEMWLAYTSSKDHVAVRTSVDAMGRILCRDEVLTCEPMAYYDDPAQANASAAGPSVNFNKRSQFAFEKEVRLVSYLPPETRGPSKVELFPKSIYRAVPTDFALEVVAHPESDEQWVETLKQLCARTKPGLCVRQSDLYRFDQG